MSAWPDGNTEPTWSNRLKTLANVFAAALLLPGDIVRTGIQSRFEEEEPTDTELVDMARRYRVSTEALLWRLKSLHLMSMDPGDFYHLDRDGESGSPANAGRP